MKEYLDRLEFFMDCILTVMTDRAKSGGSKIRCTTWLPTLEVTDNMFYSPMYENYEVKASENGSKLELQRIWTAGKPCGDVTRKFNTYQGSVIYRKFEILTAKP